MYEIEKIKNKIIHGDVLKELEKIPGESIDCITTSPPYYGLRDYGVKGQLGLEKTLDAYIGKMLLITAEFRRVLKSTGTLWWNHGDSYGGSGMGVGSKIKKESFQHNKRPATERGYEKCLSLQAHRLAIRMIDEQGWILRNTIIWNKPNCMPSSAKDRFTVDYEPIFFFSKSKKYFFEPQYEPSIWYKKDKRAITGGITKSGKSITQQGNQYAINKSGSFNHNSPGERNKRSVWRIPTQPFPEAHFATFPEALVETPIKAGCPQKGIVLDPFFGAGTTGLVALKLNRNFIGIELSKEYIKIAEDRLRPFRNKLF